MNYFKELLFAHRYFFIFFFLGFIFYFNVLDNSFVWIDNTYIVNNPQAQSFNISNLLRGSSLTATGYYRPFSSMYLTFLNTIVNNNPFYFHLIQVMMHVFNSYFIFILFRIFFKRDLAFFLSLIFLIHPMNEGKVAFISASADVLYMFFGLLALIISVKSSTKWRQIIVINILLFLSILSKESGILFFIAIFAYQLFFKRQKIWHYIFIELLTGGFYLLFRYCLDGFYTKIYALPFDHLTLFERLINIPKIFYFYISKFFVPLQIAGIHIWTITSLSVKDFYIPLFVDIIFSVTLLLIGIVIWKRYRRLMSTYCFFISLFLIGIIPYMQFVPLDYTVSARWFSFSMVGLLGIIGIFIKIINFNKVKIILAVFLLLYITFLGARTIQRNDTWADELTLFKHYAEIDDNYFVEEKLGIIYNNQKDYSNAIAHIKKSVAMKPYDNNLANLASLYAINGDIQKSKEYYYKSLAAPSIGPWRHDNITSQTLARFLILEGKYSKAESLLKQALIDYPDSASLWVLYAINEYQLHRSDHALTALKYVLPYYVDQSFVIKLQNLMLAKKTLNPSEIF